MLSIDKNLAKSFLILLSIRIAATSTVVWMGLAVWGQLGSESARMQTHPDRYFDDFMASVVYVCTFLLLRGTICRSSKYKDAFACALTVATYATVLGVGAASVINNIVPSERFGFIQGTIRMILIYSAIFGTSLIVSVILADLLRHNGWKIW